MPMQLLTILQFAGILGAYGLLVLGLPALVFYKKFQKERFCVRFLIYLTIGNFYVINLVFLLQLLHISNRVTLLAGTVLPICAAVVRIYGLSPVSSGKKVLLYGSRLVRGTIGLKQLLRKGNAGLKRLLAPQLGRLKNSLRHSFLDWILVVLTISVVLWMYGSNMLEVFGYCASDIPVHNYWVNAMGDNDIFVAGIYPFGFHCVIYYIHTVFGIETYVLMRLFGVVQTLLIHLVLLAFLRACCKSRYCAYTAVAVYVLANVFNPDIFKRYLSSLPQEFGMLFILPAVYFLFAFFAERKNEVAALEKGVKDSFFRQRSVKSSGYLWLFAMNFSLTVTVHFYDTMVTGILCIGIAIGYFFRLFRGRYFWRVMAAGLISVLVAVLPMAVAFIGGKPLQGSLGWGLSVITGSMESAEDTEEENGDSDSPETDTGGVEADSTAAGAGENGTNVEAADSGAKLPSHAGNTEPATETDNTAGESLQQTGQGFILLLAGKFQRLFRYMQENLRNYVFKYGLNREIFLGFFAVVWFDIAAGELLLFRKKRDYGARILSCGCAMALLFVILCAARIGIPAIMDTNRTRIYIVYLYPVLIAFALDVLLTLLFGWMKRKWLLYAASLATVAACIAVLVNWDMVRVPYVLSEAGLFERNEAIICLTNILRENENEKFTICSANDELRMVEDYGYHYEVITLLRSMEGANVVGNLVIPTERIYFFIEKKPLDYTIHYEGSGQMVSEEGASKPLPRGNGLSIYEGENRWIVMSRMYYWAQEFSRLYEKEMQVYYETDNFVCYVLEQNPYRLYDLSIDYGYN